MEKFYVVTNEDFLSSIKKYKDAESERRQLITRFFEENGIDGDLYYIGGTGCVGVPFEKYSKKDINLCISNTENNSSKFANQLKKDILDPDMRQFKKSSSILKEFQDICVKDGIVINNHDVRVGDCFAELAYMGYSLMKFEHDGKYYLYISTNKVDPITPLYDGFEEIKGSEFYRVKEMVESK